MNQNLGLKETVSAPPQRDTPRLISKQCKTLAQAERYQSRLYSQYNRVMLTTFPRFEEHGQYVWQVASRVSQSATNYGNTSNQK